MSESANDESAAKQPERKRGWRAIVSSGFLFGLIGMVTGIVGLVFAYQAQHEQQVVKLVASATAGPADLTATGLAVRLQLVNQSLRPLVVQGASLWQGKTRLAEATGYVSDPRALDASSVQPDAVSGSLADFPLNLGAREGRTAAFLLDVWDGVTGPAAADATSRLNRTLSALGPAASLYPPFELELDLAPGGTRRFRIQTLEPLSAQSQTAADQGSTSEPSWIVSPLGRQPTLLGLLLRHATAGESEVDLARLDLWKQGSAQQRSIVRPVIGDQATAFPLTGLPAGAYTVTFTVGDKIVANRSFALPWRREPCRVGLDEAAAPNGTGSPAWC